MKRSKNHCGLLTLALPAMTALLLSAAPAQARQAKPDTKAEAKAQAKGEGKSTGKMTVVSKEALDGDDNADGQSESIAISIDNGKVTVRRNGKEVPQDRIKRSDDGRIIILDENGKELNNVKLFEGLQGVGEGGQLFRFGDGEGGEGNGFWTTTKDNEPAPKVMLGIHMGETGPALEKHLALESGKTAIITGVLEGLPAEQAGLGEYDIIIAVNGETPADANSIHKALADAKPGDSVTFRVIQAGKKKDVKITLQGFDPEKMHKAKLLGKEPDGNLFGGTWSLPKDLHFDVNRLGDLGHLKDQILISPQNLKDWQLKMGDLVPRLEGPQPKLEELSPMIEKHLQDALKKYNQAQDKSGANARSDKDVEAQLDRLDKRMADLEKLLGKLIEQHQPKQ